VPHSGRVERRLDPSASKSDNMVKQRRMILIAEHDARRRLTLRHRLELAGHVVVGEAEDGGEALDLLRRTAPDVLLLDMGMPGLDGSYVLRSLANSHRQVTPAVVANAGSDDDAAMAAVLGADAVLRQDSSAGDLLAAVNNV
jgi:DNA-binding NarL/FixJ family response regulator